MAASADKLIDLLDLETIEVNLFRGRQPDTRMQRVFGGQVAGQALMAAARTAPEGMQVHSLHSYFMRPGDTAVPIVYDVDRIRDGRSFATRRVVARQHGRAIFALTASFQADEPGFEHQDPMPEVTPPDASPDLVGLMTAPGSHRREFWLREWSALELRYAGGQMAEGPGAEAPRSGGSREPVQRFWVRVASRLPDDALIHQAALVYLSDLTLLGVTLVPHGFHPGSPEVQAASLDHALWFHRPFRADEWLLYDQMSPSASGARGLAQGRLFAEDGRLVATVVQEGLIRPVADR